jgi:hypothetical protein
VRSTSDSPISRRESALQAPRHSGAIHATVLMNRVSVTFGSVFIGERVDTDSASLGMTNNEVTRC